MSARIYTILWLDDEPYYMESYADAINADKRFRLIRVSSVEEALGGLEDPALKPDLLLWDMILPFESLDPEETERGLRTGKMFYRPFHKRFPDTPTILFTNVRKRDVHEIYHAPGDGSRVYQKCDLLPEELLEKIEEMLGLDLEHSSQR